VRDQAAQSKGDTLLSHGRLTDKYASHGKHHMVFALMAENREGEVSARGTAVAQLPSRTG